MLASVAAFATAAHPVNLIESWQLAVENSADLAAAQVASQADELSHEIAVASIYPRLTINASAQKRNRFLGEDSDLHSGNLTVTQPIWSESLGAGLKSARQQGVLAGLQYQKAHTALFRQVVDAYFGVLAAQDTLNTTRSEIASIRTVRDHAVVRRDAGLGTETDVRIAQSRLALAEAAVIMAESSVENALLTLSELIGHYPNDIQNLNEQAPTPSLQPRQLEHWVDLALNNNIDLQIQQVAVTIASHAIKIATSESDFSANLSVRVNDKFGGSDTLGDHVVALLSISKSFSAGGLVAKQTRQAALRYEAELQKLQGLKSRTATLASSAYRNAASLIDQIEALELAVSANESSYELTQNNYDVGLITSLSVLEAQQDLFEVQRDLLKARYDYLRSLIALEQVAGTLDLADLDALNRLLQ